MLSKITSKNQITLPKAVMAQVSPAEYFEVQAVNDSIVLTPVRLQKADAVREKLAQLHITEADIGDAITWARRG
jgi:antitoxin component of MazEF toxin-antitoxin module